MSLGNKTNNDFDMMNQMCHASYKISDMHWLYFILKSTIKSELSPFIWFFRNFFIINFSDKSVINGYSQWLWKMILNSNLKIRHWYLYFYMFIFFFKDYVLLPLPLVWFLRSYWVDYHYNEKQTALLQINSSIFCRFR